MGGERLVPLEQVFDRGVEGARGMGDRHVHVVAVGQDDPQPAGVAGGTMLEDRRAVLVARVVHLQGIEDRLLEERRVVLARGGLDDLPEHDVSGVAVAEFLARLEVERLVLELGDQLLERDPHGQGLQEVRERRVVGDARGVGEQVVDRDLVPRLGRVGQVFLDLVLDVQLAPLLEDHDGHGRELLGDRPQAELGLGRVGHVMLQVGHAVALAEEDLAVASHQDRAAEMVALDPRGHVFLDPGRELVRIGRGGLGRRGWTEAETARTKAGRNPLGRRS